MKSTYVISAITVFIFTCFIFGSAQATLVYVNPSTQSIAQVGDTKIIDINVSDVTNLYGFQMNISFNPSVLEFVSFSEGTFLAFDGHEPFYYPTSSEATTGNLSYVGSRIGTVPGVNGGGVLFSITFKAISQGSSDITLSEIILSDSLPNEILTDHDNGKIIVGTVTILPPSINTITNPTNQSPLTVGGTAKGGSTVEVFVNGVSVGSTIASSGGDFQLSNVTLTEGNNEITARASDGGIVSDASSPICVVLDTIPPAQPFIYHLASPTNEDTINISGEAEVHSTIELYVNSISKGSTTATGIGSFSFSAIPLSIGTNNIQAEATDKAGNTSPLSAQITVVRNAIVDVIVYVNSQAQPGGDGSSWTKALRHIQAGIDAAETNKAEVWVAEGEYVERVVLKEGITLYGGFFGSETTREQRDYESNETIINGHNTADDISTVEMAHNSRIDGFTITNGTSGWGGGIYCFYGAHCVIAHNVICNNKATVSGAGIYLDDTSHVTIYENIIRDNEACYGGAMYTDSHSYVKLEENKIYNNSAVYQGEYGGDAGSLYLNTTTIEIVNNVIHHNEAEYKGGAIYIWQGVVTISDNEFFQNTGEWGGVINGASDVTIKNNNFHDNHARISGGAMYLWGEEENPTIYENIFHQNVALYGGALYIDSVKGGVIKKNIISQNKTDSDDLSFEGEGYAGGIYLGHASPLIIHNIITGNTAKQRGGGIYGWDSDAIISKNEISYNSVLSGNGGGINMNFSPIIEKNLIHHNISSCCSGGGIYLNVDSTAEVTGNRIYENEAWHGPGINITTGGTPCIELNVFRRNKGGDGGCGGGINLDFTGKDGLGARIRKNLFEDNEIGWGGALHIWGGQDIEVSNNIISGNKVIHNGGAIAVNLDSTSCYTNNTFYMNTAPGNGSCFSVLSTASVDIMNSIVWDPLLHDPIIVESSAGATYTITYSDTYNWIEPGIGNINVNPEFREVQVGNFHLLSTSPCINAGNPAVQYNDINGSRNDMGAHGGPDPICLECFSTLIRATGEEHQNSVRISEVRVGILSLPDMVVAPSLPPPYTVNLKIKDMSSPLQYYSENIKKMGTSEEQWLLKVEVPEDIQGAYPTSYYPLLSWDKYDFNLIGRIQLWSSDENGNLNTLLVNDMRMTDEYQTRQQDGIYFSIVWTWEEENYISKTMDLPVGWSMISLPVIPYNKTLSELFPDAVVVYGYEKDVGYVRVNSGDNLEIGKGYWILLNESKTFNISGQIMYNHTFSINKDGWQMIGGCSFSAQASLDNCTIGLIYKYIQGMGYQRVLESAPLEPGKGYWMLLNNVTDQGSIIIQGTM